MKNNINKVNEQVISKLKLLISVPPRNFVKAKNSRNHYIAFVNKISQQKNLMPVSLTPFSRLKEWIEKFINPYFRKEHQSMATLFTSVLVILGLLFGGAGATAYAAQSSLPNEILYPVKTLGEDFHLQVATNTADQIQLSVEYANRRVDEAASMLNKSEDLPESLVNRLEMHYNLALQLAAGLDGETQQQVYEQIRSNIRQQEQILSQLGSSSISENAVFARLREVLRNQNRICEAGLEDSLQFQRMLQQKFQNQRDTGEETSQSQNNTQDQSSPGVGGESQNPESPQGGMGSGNGSDANTQPSENSNNSGTGVCQGCTPMPNGTGSEGGSGNNPGSNGQMDNGNKP